ncbi:hypothetical protein [Promicromonospora xylanilytica]
MRTLLPRHAEPDHERQVEQQLQRGGGPRRLVRVAAGHPPGAVVQH